MALEAPTQSIGLTRELDASALLRQHTEFQRDYNWALLMPQQVNGTAGLEISKFCKRITFGDKNIETVRFLIIQAKKQFIPDSLLIDQVQLTFLAPCPDIVQDYFSAWRQLMIDNSGNYTPQAAYKFSIFIYLYTQRGNEGTIIQLKGAFPVKVPAYNLSYANEDILKYEIVLSVDDFAIQ